MTDVAGGARIAMLLLVVLALAAVLTGLANGFAYDDVALLVSDSRLHSLGSLPGRLLESWWPSGLYRPVSLGWLSAQWLVGNGSPLVFHLVSTVLYVLACLLVYRLAIRCGAAPWAALAGAAVFAVHPVHAEVTANVVGQAELLSTLFVLAAVNWYLAARQGPNFSRLAGLGLAGLFLLAAHSKEGGYVLPALLLLAEVLVVRDSRPLRQRVGALREGWLLTLAAFLAALAVRRAILGGFGGETPHPQVAGLGMMERAVAMLAVVPEWARLLIWPARLQVEYGPPGLVMTPVPGPAHWIGLLLLLLVAGLLVVALRRRATLVALGIGWMAVALAPVANVVFPTGLILAERTLFLPSVGLALAIAGVAYQALGASGTRGRRWVTGFAVAVGVVVIAGAVHSARRQMAWRDSLTLHAQSALDAPRSYRAQMMLGRELAIAGDTAQAIRQYQRAIGLWQSDPQPFRDLGQLLRVQGRCAEAVPLLARGLAADSLDQISRSRLVECLLVERRWDEAEREIERGLGQGVVAYRNAQARLQAAREPAP